MFHVLRAKSTTSDATIGWRFRNKIVSEMRSATVYQSLAAAMDGKKTAERRWPEYEWHVDRWTHQGAQTVRAQKMIFTRDEVVALIRKEREEIAEYVSQSGAPEFAAAILTGRAWPLEGL